MTQLSTIKTIRSPHNRSFTLSQLRSFRGLISSHGYLWSSYHITRLDLRLSPRPDVTHGMNILECSSSKSFVCWLTKGWQTWKSQLYLQDTSICSTASWSIRRQCPTCHIWSSLDIQKLRVILPFFYHVFHHLTRLIGLFWRTRRDYQDRSTIFVPNHSIRTPIKNYTSHWPEINRKWVGWQNLGIGNS